VGHGYNSRAPADVAGGIYGSDNEVFAFLSLGSAIRPLKAKNTMATILKAQERRRLAL
jgi:hypothetical protein